MTNTSTEECSVSKANKYSKLTAKNIHMATMLKVQAAICQHFKK